MWYLKSPVYIVETDGFALIGHVLGNMEMDQKVRVNVLHVGTHAQWFVLNVSQRNTENKFLQKLGHLFNNNSVRIHSF